MVGFVMEGHVLRYMYDNGMDTYKYMWLDNKLNPQHCLFFSLFSEYSLLGLPLQFSVFYPCHPILGDQ